MQITERKRYLKMALAGLSTVAILFGLTTGSVSAHDDPDEKLPPHKRPHTAEPTTGGQPNLAAAATNPIANLVQFQLQDAYSWENHNSSGYSNASLIQPVVPFKLPWDKVPLLVTRTTLPYVTTPDLDDPINDRKRGFGDTTIVGFFLPKLKTKGVQLGIGPTLVIPTAGDNQFTGSGKWQLGPSLLYLNLRTPKLQWGMFAFQLWDVADGNGNGSSNREDVSKLNLQPILTKHFNKGWYVSSPDSPQTYNFETKKWTWNLGPVVGRVFRIGKQPVKMFGAVYYNPENDAGPTAKWTAKVGLTLLFPK